jgi:hypothetical protein
VGFSDSIRKRRLQSRLDRLLELRTDGRTDEARAAGEQLLEDAEALVGPDDPITLYTREELALTYFDDEPQRARELLEELLADEERVFGRESMEALTLRCHLPGMYGLIGDHENARALAATLAIECERELGEDHPHTRKMRETVATAERELAQARLVNLLSAKWTPEGDPVPEAEAQQIRERSGAVLGTSRPYRSVARLQARGGGKDWLEWQLAYAGGLVEATQFAYEDGSEALRQGWLTTPAREYQIIPSVGGTEQGVIANAHGARHDDVNEALLTPALAELLNKSPVRAYSVTEEARYVVLQYDQPPPAVLRWLARNENGTNGLGSTRLWVDAETAELVRAETDLPVEVLSTSEELFQFRAVGFEEDGRNVEIEMYRADRGLPAREGRVELRQVFGSYGEEITIDEPDSEGVFEFDETS